MLGFKCEDNLNVPGEDYVHCFGETYVLGLQFDSSSATNDSTIYGRRCKGFAVSAGDEANGFEFCGGTNADEAPWTGNNG